MELFWSKFDTTRSRDTPSGWGGRAAENSSLSLATTFFHYKNSTLLKHSNLGGARTVPAEEKKIMGILLFHPKKVPMDSTL